MSHTVTVHSKSESIQDVVTIASRYCGTQFLKDNDVEWELWKSYVAGIDVSIYELGGSLAGDNTEFADYPIVVSFYSSHACEDKQAMMRYIAILLARELGWALGRSWLVALESSVVIERSAY